MYKILQYFTKLHNPVVKLHLSNTGQMAPLTRRLYTSVA